MLTEHTVHNTSVSCEAVISIKHFCVPVTFLIFKYFVQTVGHAFIWSKDTEVLVFFIQFEDVADVSAKFDHILSFCFARLYFNTVIAEVRKTKIFQKKSAICMWVGTETCISLRSQFSQFRDQASVFVKQFLRTIAFQPLLQKFKMFRFFHSDRNLMSTERTFNLKSVNNLRTCPSLRSTKDDHWPYRTFRIIVLTGVLLDRFDFFDHCVHCFSHLLVHCHWVVTFNEIWFPATALEEAFKFFMRKTGEDSRVADLISI